MKKTWKVLVIVLLILAIITGALVVWQWNNVKVFFTALQYSADEIDTLITENEGKLDSILNDLSEGDMRGLSDEERDMLLNGELSEEEAISLIQKHKEENATAPKDTGRVDEIISRIYLLRSEYVGALSGLEAEAKAAAKKIPKAERTISKKLALIEAYTGRGAALEKQCDAKMENLIQELKAELQKTGGNTSIISEIRSTYASEKRLKKSQLFGKYSKHLK